MFVGATGKIDVFDGRTLCWISYEVGRKASVALSMFFFLCCFFRSIA